MASSGQLGGVLVALVCLLGSAQSVDIGFGPCPTKQVVQNFDVQSYMGKWYEVERFWQVFELNGKCVTAEYAFNNVTEKVSVRNAMVDTRSQQPKAIEGFAELTNSSSPPEAKLTVTFKIPIIGDQSSPYWVLATDYNNYSLVYSCTSGLNLLKAESAWILTRKPVPDPEIQQIIENAITEAGVNRKSFLKTTQNCNN